MTKSTTLLLACMIAAAAAAPTYTAAAPKYTASATPARNTTRKRSSNYAVCGFLIDSRGNNFIDRLRLYRVS
jgi:hypothetical protein